MRILLHRGDGVTQPWIAGFAKALPQAQVVVWREGADTAPCDYAVLFAPPAAMVPELQSVKAIFLTGAGADAILKVADQLPPVPIVRLGDAGMASQMAEYAVYAVLRYFRRFDEYEAQARARVWKQLPQYEREDFTVGVLGTGVLGKRVLDALAPFGFPLRGWSRTPKHIDGVQCFAGADQLADFLRGTRVLVCMLPLTPDTASLLNLERLSLLAPGAYVVNVARGGHVVDEDLLAQVQSGHIAGAMLDVFGTEPLPASHPFWHDARIAITPHAAALTLPGPSAVQIAHKIQALERGDTIDDVVDVQRGY
ncbi:glyoxylate/hydroxypyruvate reductase A [Massilia sp. PAMC28688]|uniref:2-hydroxyacid dehydrogenase n=1 Tax=Massilia sp. PAMC28688 TaxID=2861283 RepID=UPI001C635791|nr:glyoxylate/hydroxypyruvate reductase A [Massilia sp. PAMC28688]QYF95275.1 glyoxylate/hydroxypyruvate reductase A [Massilia sp. PAMC28688]